MDGVEKKCETCALKITSPVGEVIPYVAEARAYLLAGKGANVKDFCVKMENAYLPVEIAWEDGLHCSSYCVEYGRHADFSDAICDRTQEKHLFVYNLYKASTYYLRVSGYDEEGNTLATAVGEFFTTSLGPRVMRIDGIHNVRDVGGYDTVFGKKTKQGKIFRGGTLAPADVYPSLITEEGKRYMRDCLGIKTEMDFRGVEEAGLTESLLYGARLIFLTMGGYELEIERHKEIFSLFANEENYPIYMHCTGGADRTGTIAFLLNALLGVDEEALIQDYEFTSFSLFGERNSQEGIYSTYFKPFHEKLEGYAGATLQEKTESWLLARGVTADEIAAIKRIMLE